MIALDESQTKQLKDYFKGAWECEQQINDLNERISTFSESKKEFLNNACKLMGYDKKNKEEIKGVKKAYAQYVADIQNLKFAEARDETYIMIKDGDWLGLESNRNIDE